MVQVTAYIKVFVALFVLVNPLEGIPIFLARTEGLEAREQISIGQTATIAVVCIMLATLAIGRGLLDVLNISIPDFSTAGGVIIFLIALKMVLGPSAANDSTVRFKSKEEERGFGIVPLAMPLLAGPGVISALIVYAGRGPTGHGNSLFDYLVLVIIIGAVGVMTGLALRAALPLQRLLGQTGIEVATRISGILVAAIAVGMIIQGLQQSFPMLAQR